VQNGTTWHEATDNLAGTADYGTPCESTENCSFAIPYTLSDFDYFKFASGDGSKWMIMHKD
jgi:hypothetical protein